MKFNCEKEDELIKLIKDKGFSPVLTPRDNIKPLQLLVRDDKGVMAWFSDLFRDPTLTHTGDTLMDVIIGDDALEIIESELTAGISGSQSSEITLDAGAELALFFLKAKDNSTSDDDRKAALKAALASMEKVSFLIDGRTFKRGVAWSSIDSYLFSAKIEEDLSTFKDMILNGQVYIITHVLSSDSFTFKGENSISASLEGKLPEIKKILEGNFKGAISLSESSGINYKGDKQMVFGVQAVKLFAKVENGKMGFKIERAGIIARGSESEPTEEVNVEELDLGNENFLML